MSAPLSSAQEGLERLQQASEQVGGPVEKRLNEVIEYGRKVLKDCGEGNNFFTYCSTVKVLYGDGASKFDGSYTKGKSNISEVEFKKDIEGAIQETISLRESIENCVDDDQRDTFVYSLGFYLNYKNKEIIEDQTYDKLDEFFHALEVVKSHLSAVQKIELGIEEKGQKEQAEQTEKEPILFSTTVSSNSRSSACSSSSLSSSSSFGSQSLTGSSSGSSPSSTTTVSLTAPSSLSTEDTLGLSSLIPQAPDTQQSQNLMKRK